MTRRQIKLFFRVWTSKLLKFTSSQHRKEIKGVNVISKSLFGFKYFCAPKIQMFPVMRKIKTPIFFWKKRNIG